jgi:hypothetical protein
MKRYVSLAGLAFELQISYPTALAWLRDGRLVSDAVCNRIFLFDVDKVFDLVLQRILRAPTPERRAELERDIAHHGSELEFWRGKATPTSSVESVSPPATAAPVAMVITPPPPTTADYASKLAATRKKI